MKEKGKGKGFKDLLVWRRAKDLTVKIYRITQTGNFSKDFGLQDQIRRAAVSVPSNIAEGDERDTNKEAIRFFYIAKGSLAEMRTQLQIAQEIGYLADQDFNQLDSEALEISKMLGGLIKARRPLPSLTQTSNPEPLTSNL